MNIETLITKIGFNSLKDFKDYMIKKAKLNEYGAICYTEKRNGWELNYSNNCNSKFGIGGNNKGIFSDIRFN